MAKLKLDEPEIDACRYCGSDRIEDIESGIEQIDRIVTLTVETPFAPTRRLQHELPARLLAVGE